MRESVLATGAGLGGLVHTRRRLTVLFTGTRYCTGSLVLLSRPDGRWVGTVGWRGRARASVSRFGS